MAPYEELVEQELKNSAGWSEDHNYYFHATKQPGFLMTFLFGQMAQLSAKNYLVNKTDRGLTLIPIGGLTSQKFKHDQTINIPTVDIKKLKVTKPFLSFGQYYWVQLKTTDGKSQQWQVYKKLHKDYQKMSDNVESFAKWANDLEIKNKTRS